MGKRILITSFTFPPQRNGVSHVVEAHAVGLARLGYEVTVATEFDPQRDTLAFGPVRVEQFCVNGNGKWLMGGGYRGEIERYQRYVSDFCGEAILCHCWQTWSTDLAVPAFASCQAAKVLVSHGVSANAFFPTPGSALTWLSWRPYVWRMPRMLASFDHVTLLSDMVNRTGFYDRWLMRRMGYDRFSVIPNGASEGRFDHPQARAASFRSRFSLGERPVVLCLANYSHTKGQDIALRAFLRARPKDAVLVFIGSELNEYARRLARSVPAGADSSAVRFLEKLDEHAITSAYCAADVFLCPSRLEVQPLVVIDAIAAGVPWIAMDVGCVGTMPGGIVVRKSGEMAEQISRLLRDDALRARLKAVGFAAARSVYNWDATVRSYDRLLDRIARTNDQEPLNQMRFKQPEVRDAI